MKYLLVLATVLGIVAIGSANSFAATDMYMQYGTIKGDSLATGHTGWIDLGNYQFDIEKPTSIGSGIQESGVPKISAITITKTMDSSSTQLMQEAFAGTGQTVKIDLVKSSSVAGQPFTYGEYVLSNAIVTGYSVSSGADVPTESINISFTKITFTYTPQNNDGSPGTSSTASWNLITNTSN